MTEKQQPAGKTKGRRVKPVLAACLLLFSLGGLATVLLMLWREPGPQRSDTDVPLGVEQAVIIRYD